MNRKDFLKKGFLGTGILVATGSVANVLKNDIDELVPLDIIGFNHLPNETSKIMNNTVLHRAESRGHANHGDRLTYAAGSNLVRCWRIVPPATSAASSGGRRSRSR